MILDNSIFLNKHYQIERDLCYILEMISDNFIILNKHYQNTT